MTRERFTHLVESALEEIYDAMLENGGRELLYFPIYNYQELIPELLALGHAYEKITAHRRPPRFAKRTTPV